MNPEKLKIFLHDITSLALTHKRLEPIENHLNEIQKETETINSENFLEIMKTIPGILDELFESVTIDLENIIIEHMVEVDGIAIRAFNGLYELNYKNTFIILIRSLNNNSQPMTLWVTEKLRDGDLVIFDLLSALIGIGNKQAIDIAKSQADAGNPFGQKLIFGISKNPGV